MRQPKVIRTSLPIDWLTALSQSLLDSHLTEYRPEMCAPRAMANFYACVLEWLARNTAEATPIHLYQFMVVRKLELQHAIADHSLQLSLINGCVILINGEMYDIITTGGTRVPKPNIQDVITTTFVVGDQLVSE